MILDSQPTRLTDRNGLFATAATLVALFVALDGLFGVVLLRSARLPFAVVPIVSVVVMAQLLRGADLRIASAKPADGFIAAGVALTLLGLGRSATNWPFFGPVGYSVDGAHHGAMVTWIARHGRLPDHIEPQLRQFSEYFLFTHRVIGDVSRITGLLPLRAMGIVGLTLALLSIVATSLMADGLCGSIDATTWVRGVAIGAVFAAAAGAHAYGLDMVLESYYLAQLCALVLCSVACVCVIDPRYRTLAPMFGGASIACYPLQAGVFPGILVIAWLVVRERWILGVLIRTLLIGAIGLIAQAPYLGRALAMSHDEGSVVNLSLQTAGGPIVVLLIVLGAVEALVHVRTVRHGRSSVDQFEVGVSGWAPIFVLCGFIVSIGQYVIFRLAATAGIVSSYSANKTVFHVAPFALALVGLGAARLAQRLPNTSRVTETLLAATTASLAFVAFTQTHSQYRETRRLVSPDAYRLARSLPKAVAASDVGVVGINLDPYVLWWTGLTRPVTPAAYRLLEAKRPFDSWPRRSVEHYLIVDGALARERYSSFPGVVVVKRVGSAALLRRSDDT
jgi:hypothetical protein